MSVLDPMKGIAALASALRCYAYKRYADPDLVCLAVLVPALLEGIVIGLDSDAVNDGRRFDPLLLVAHWQREGSNLLVVNSYATSRLRWRHMPEAQLVQLRALANVQINWRARQPKPLRHGI